MRRMMRVEKPRRGRPPLGDAGMRERIVVRMSRDLLHAIDVYRTERGDGVDRAQIVRELVVEGLRARGILSTTRK